MALNKIKTSYQNSAQAAEEQEQEDCIYENPDDDEVQPRNIMFNSQSIRHGFIRKAYMILFGQLAITFAIVALFVFSLNVKIFANLNLWFVCVATICMLLTISGIILSEHVRRKTPINFIFLALFTLSFSTMLGVTLSPIAPRAVILALVTTASICLASTLFSMQSKYDLTPLSGLLVTSLVTMLIFSVVTTLMPGRLTTMVCSFLSVLLFSSFLVLDTQLIMGGYRQYAINPEEYIYTALSLYVDILNIFMETVKLVDMLD